MNDFTTKLLKTLLEGKDITEIFRYHVECAVNQLLQYELREFLDYDKYDRKGSNSGNSRNGYYEHTLKTEYGDLSLRIPRDRNGEFENQTLTPYKRQNDTVESMIIHLYSNGMTTEEIAHIVEKMYGHHYTKQTVSNITAAVVGDIQAFNHRALSKRYAVIYLDATHLPVRRDTMVEILLEAASSMKNLLECEIYLVNTSKDEPNTVYVYEVWSNENAHQESLTLESTQTLIKRAKPIITGMGRISTLETIGGKGI